MPSDRASRAVLFGLVLSAWSHRARAQPSEPVPFHLTYDTAVDSCPSSPSFLEAIRARTDRARLVAADQTAVAFDVSIASDSNGQVAGRLAIHEPEGAEQLRTVAGATCADVAAALALVIALYLDPDAESRTEPEPTPATTTPPPAPLRAPRVPAPTRPTPEQRKMTIGTGASVGGLGGLGPSIAPTAAAFADLTLAGSLPAWVRPSFRLSIAGAATTAEVGPGTQRYFLLAGVVRACPFGFAVAREIRLGPCAGMMAGTHRGTSDGVPNARAQDRPWLTPTTTVRLAWNSTDAVALELEGGLVAPLQRTRFFLAPDLTLFRTPAISGMATMAVLVRFR